jgi:pimeloyl-ACP methyl ester carboxylesterase
MARFVLVAGAWHGAWCWEFVVPLLEKMGHRAVAAELPGMGSDNTPLGGLSLTAWARAVADVVEADLEPVILAGHSRGGVVISQTAELVPDRIRLNVYLTAILMKNGESGLDSSQLVPSDALRPRNFEATADGLAFKVIPDLALSYGGSPPELVIRALAQMTPEPNFALVTPLALSTERYGRVPRAYIECLADETVPLALQRAMQAREPCGIVRAIDTDHCPTYSAPAQLADVLNELANFAGEFS